MLNEALTLINIHKDPFKNRTLVSLVCEGHSPLI